MNFWRSPCLLTFVLKYKVEKYSHWSLTRGQLWVVLSMSKWDCLLIQHDFTAPPPPPPPCPGLQLIMKDMNRAPCFEPLSWLNCWHDFCVLKTYPLLPPTSRTPFRLTNFSAFFGKLYFRIVNPLLLQSFRCTPSVEPQSAMFLHTICQRFCQTSEPCSNPCFSLLFNGQWREGAGGGREEGGSMFEHGFLTDKARPNYTFQPFTLQRKVHSRCWKSLLVKTKYTADPHSMEQVVFRLRSIEEEVNFWSFVHGSRTLNKQWPVFLGCRATPGRPLSA